MAALAGPTAMPITFQCQKCKTGMTVPDHLAGKRGRCKKCQAAIVVPDPGATPAPGWAANAPPPPPLPPADHVIDADAAALEALAEPKEDEKAPEAIEFECPQCSEPVKLPLDLAGKRHPCPACSRVIPVPMPANRKPSEWRDTGPKKPAGAKRDDIPAPEGAWGAGQAQAASLEALEEAGVIPEKDRPLTLYQKWEMPILIGVPSVLALVGAWFLWGWLSASAEQTAYNKAVGLLGPDAASKSTPDARAALRSQVARYLLGRPKDEKAAATARDHLMSAVGDATGDDALLLELIDAHLMLGGPLPWDEAQRPIRQCLEAIRTADARQLALRKIAAHLGKAEQAHRAAPLAAQATAGSAADARAEAIAAVALQLHADKHAGHAAKAADMALQPYADVKGKNRPPLGPTAVAVAVALGRKEPQRLPMDTAEGEAALFGKIQGMGFKGEATGALPSLKHESLASEARCRAAALLADASPDKATVEEAMKFVVAGNRVAWANYRIALAAIKAGVDPAPAVNALGASPLKEWVALAALRHRIQTTRAAGDEPLAPFGANTPPGLLARTELARLDGGSSARWKDWDEVAAAFGWIGAAQAMQGKPAAR